MKKIFSILGLFLLVFALAGCKPEVKERTYKADGVYLAWDLEVHEVDFSLPDGSKVKVNTPQVSMVKVEIRNDEIVDFYIDEIQATATGTVVENVLTKISFAFNKQTKKELEYAYMMSQIMKTKEWFIQATILENNWLENNKVEALSTMTITHDNYVAIAKRAVQNAIDGKVAAIYPENTTYYGAVLNYVTADINSEGKISNVKFDVHHFNYLDKSADQLDPTKTTKYMKFNWDQETKYAAYPEMMPGVRWQDMIDVFANYINTNGWDGSIFAVGNKLSTKPTEAAATPVEALASVTITCNMEVLLMNQLWKYFPKGWK